MWLIWGRHGLFTGREVRAPEGSSLNSQQLPLCNGRVKQRRGCIASLGTPRRMRLLVMVLSLHETAAKDKTRGRDI